MEDEDSDTSSSAPSDSSSSESVLQQRRRLSSRHAPKDGNQSSEISLVRQRRKGRRVRSQMLRDLYEFQSEAAAADKVDDIVAMIETRRKEKFSVEEVNTIVEDRQKIDSRRRQYAIVFYLAVLAVGHVIATIYLFVFPSPYEFPNTCVTEKCQRYALWLREAMDPAIDPCEDFYAFTCGNIMNGRTPLLQKPMSLKLFTDGIPFKYRGNIKLGEFLHPVMTYPMNQLLPFYKSCVHTGKRDSLGLTPLVALFKSLKIFDLTDWGDATPSISWQVANIYKMTNKCFFFHIHEVLYNVVILRLDTPDAELQLVDPQHYRKTMKKILSLFEHHLNLDGEEEIDTIIYVVMRFEAQLYHILNKGIVPPIFGFPTDKFIQMPEVLHPKSKFYKPAVLKWEELLFELYYKDQIDPPEIFFNYVNSFRFQEDRYYYVVLEQLLVDTNYYTIMRYFQWSLIKYFGFDLDTKLSKLLFSLFRTASSSSEVHCFRTMFNDLNALAANRYLIGSHSDGFNDIFSKIQQGFYNHSETFKEFLRKMSQENPLMLSYLDTLETASFNLPNIESTAPLLEYFYEGLNVSTENYFANLLQVKAIRAKNNLLHTLWLKPYEIWPVSGFSLHEVTKTDKAMRMANYRYLSVPLGALYEPFFDIDNDIISLAGFGFWVELYYYMHQALRDAESRIGAEALYGDEARLSFAIIKEYEARMQCIKQAYGNGPSRNRSLKIDFNAPLNNEAIGADSAALDLAFKLLEDFIKSSKTWSEREMINKFPSLPGFELYTPQQLFSQALARHACRNTPKEILEYLTANGPPPFELRINGLFRHKQEFATTWNCSKTAYMNHPLKCSWFSQTTVSDLVQHVQQLIKSSH